MSSQQRQDAKHERILRSLLTLPDNKRCADCETLGPQYVVTDFNVFVCTVCSGIHRQFNHRVKGVSMATFKPEEIEAIQNGGNAVTMGTYLARWSPTDLPRPTDRAPPKVRDWVEAVFVRKRFYAEPQFTGGGGGAADHGASHHHQPSVPGHLTAPSVSRASSDVAALEGAAWGAAPAAALPAAPDAPAAPSQWAMFDDAPAVAPAAAAPSPPAEGGGWATFDAAPAAAPVAAFTSSAAGGRSTAAATPVAAAPPPTQHPPPAAAPPQPPTTWASFDEPASSAGWASFDAPPSAAASSTLPPTPASAARAELPSDLFMEAAAVAAPPPPPSQAPASASGAGSSSPPPPPPADPFSTLGLRGALPASSPGPAPTAASPASAQDAGSAAPKKATGNPFA